MSDFTEGSDVLRHHLQAAHTARYDAKQNRTAGVLAYLDIREAWHDLARRNIEPAT